MYYLFILLVQAPIKRIFSRLSTSTTRDPTSLNVVVSSLSLLSNMNVVYYEYFSHIILFYYCMRLNSFTIGWLYIVLLFGGVDGTLRCIQILVQGYKLYSCIFVRRIIEIFLFAILLSIIGAFKWLIGDNNLDLKFQT